MCYNKVLTLPESIQGISPVERVERRTHWSPEGSSALRLGRRYRPAFYLYRCRNAGI